MTDADLAAVPSTLDERCPASLPGTIVFDTERTGHRIFVHVPPGDAPEGGWPILYMVDGNAVIATAVDAVRVQSCYPSGTNVAPGMVVAIGYPTDGAYDPLRRSWDLSPPPGQAYPPFNKDGPEVRTGGGEGFLRFIEDDLKPLLESRFPIDRDRQTLFGHSFGGLFALYALCRRPRAFRTWVAVSPAISWEDSVIAGIRDTVTAETWHAFDGRVLLSAGAYESADLAPFQRGRPDAETRREHMRKTRTLETARDWAAEINALAGREDAASYETFAGENHMSVLPVAVGRAVQAAFALECDAP